MFKKPILTCIVLLAFLDVSFSQDMNKIIQMNDNYYNANNQVIKITYCSKTRYKTDSVFFRKLIYLGDPSNNYAGFTFIDSFYVLNFKVVNDTLFIKHRDSISYFSGEKYALDINWNTWEFPGILDNLAYLKQIPIKRNAYIFNRKYNSSKVIYQSKDNDTTIILQKKKKTQVQRKLFLDSFNRIFKIEYVDFNTDNLQERWFIELTIFPNSNILTIADSLDFGPYRNYQNKAKLVKVEIKDSVRLNIFPLIDGKIITVDTSKLQYYVVDFWYLSCKPCHLLRTELEKLYLQYDTNRIKFYGFNISDKLSDIRAFNAIKGHMIPEINRLTSKFIQFQYDMHPTILILDKQHNIVKKIHGYSKENIKMLTSILDGKV